MAAFLPMFAVRSALFRAALARDKHGFAKRARNFAKRALPRRPIPGFPLLWIGCAGATALMVVTGGLGTGQMPWVQRAFFWALLMAFNGLKWQIWFHFMVRKPADWPRASILGMPLLNLSLPLEIALCGRAVGIPIWPDLFQIWGKAFAISVVIVTVAAMVAWVALRRSNPAARTLEDGLLQRARVAPEMLAAIQAEDHYCRVFARDGQSVLIHYRFSDALAELSDLEGAQVHRGAWVASDAVLGARRDGRRWRLILGDGINVPVSATYAPEARRRHWLRQPPRTMA